MEDRLSWRDLIQKDNNQLNNNLLPNVAINNKQSFDEGNSTINRLNDEILKLKRKTQFVDEKDRQIEKLETQITELKQELETKKSELKEMKSQMETLGDLNLNIDSNELERENSLLKREIEKLKRENSTNIDFDYNVKVEDTIVLNIDKVKYIIKSKSGYSQDDKVDFILKRYKLKNGDSVDRKLLSKIIQEIL
jgi:predicted RNase H-like nuclease (RuvC/YqgF family)